MNAVSPLYKALCERRETIAEGWYARLYPLCAAPLDASQLRQLTLELTDQLIACLAGEPFAPECARAVGEALADLRLPDPTALEQAMAGLPGEIARGLAEGEAAALLPRLAATWAGVAAGYCQRIQSLLLHEQEEIYRATLTALKRTEEALRESEARYRTVSRLTSDYAFAIRVHADGTFTTEWVTEAYWRITGLPSGTLLGERWLEMVHPDDRAIAAQNMRRAFAGQASEAEFRIRTVAGEERWLRAAGWPEWDAAHERVVRVYGAVQDITRYKAIEAALRASEERYRAISELTSDFAYGVRVGPEGRMTLEWITDAFQRLFGITQAELEALEDWFTLVHPDDQSKLNQHIQTLLESGRPETIEVRLITASGAVRWLRITNRPLFDEQEGRVVRVLGAAQDITGRKLAEQHALQLDRLAAVGRLAATMAHEINNPLQAIRTNLDLAMDFPLEEEERQARLRLVQHEVERLIKISSRAMSLVRPPQVQQEPVSLATVVRQAVSLIERQLAQSGVELTLDFPAALPPVYTSSDLLLQVMLNLMLNAVEAMEGGGTLHIAARHVDRHVSLTFVDSGPGFTPAALHRLFEPFYTTKQGGTGLGLSLCHAIIQQHGGTISAGNAPGGGAIVTITLPLGQSAGNEEEA